MSIDDTSRVTRKAFSGSCELYLFYSVSVFSFIHLHFVKFENSNSKISKMINTFKRKGLVARKSRTSPELIEISASNCKR